MKTHSMMMIPLLLLVAACSSSSGGSNGKACTPGLEQACPSGCTGTQVCKDDGSGYDAECSCGDAAGPSDDAAGSGEASSGQDGASEAAVSSTALFTGTWLCNLMLDQKTCTSNAGGTTTYPPEAVTTVMNGASLSIYAQDSDSEPQSWFCGFNYVVSGLNASLVGQPTCVSYETVVLQSATITVTADGNKLTLQESGADTSDSITCQSTMTGSCSRN